MPGSRRHSHSGSRAASRASCISASETQSLVMSARDSSSPEYRQACKSTQRFLSPNKKAALDGPRQCRRAKRSGYNHPAAMQSSPDLLHMPPYAQIDYTRPDSGKSATPAGVKSDRMVQLLRCTFDDSKSTRRPQTRTDPITHRQFEAEEHRDERLLQGAAGVTTDRLTLKQTSWITHQEGSAKSSAIPSQKTDPISHVGGPPDPITKGIRRFGYVGCCNSKIPMFHVSTTPQRLGQDEVNNLMKTKEVRTGGGEVLYCHGGEEDMIPAARNNYIKADLPPSASHKAENDKHFLPSFFRVGKQNRKNPFVESDDMYYAMCGQTSETGSVRPDYEEMLSRMQMGRRPSPSETDHLSGCITERALARRRTSKSWSARNTGSSVITDSRGAQTYREPSSLQRRQRAKSADVYARRTSAGGSVADSGFQSTGSHAKRIRHSPHDVASFPEYPTAG